MVDLLVPVSKRALVAIAALRESGVRRNFYFVRDAGLHRLPSLSLSLRSRTGCCKDGMKFQRRSQDILNGRGEHKEERTSFVDVATRDD